MNKGRGRRIEGREGGREGRRAYLERAEIHVVVEGGIDGAGACEEESDEACYHPHDHYIVEVL